MGLGPYSCAEPGSLAPAWPPLGAGSREGSRHLHFRRLFSVLERSRGAMRLSPRRPEKRGPAPGSRGAAGRGEGRAFCKPQGPHMGLSTFPGPTKPAQVPSIPLPGWGHITQNRQGTAQGTQPFLPLLQGWAALSPLVNDLQESPQDIRQTPSSYAGSRSPMQEGMLTCHGAARMGPSSGKDRGRAGWWHKSFPYQRPAKPGESRAAPQTQTGQGNGGRRRPGEQLSVKL